MKILVNAIPEEGMHIKGELDSKKLSLDTKQINFSSPVSAECFVSKTKDDLFVKCNLKAIARETCSRCLEEFDLNLEKEIDLYYQLQGEHAVELDDGIKDEIIIDYPIKILCKQDCKGLCRQCGKNLNQGLCSCKEG